MVGINETTAITRAIVESLGIYRVLSKTKISTNVR